MGRVLGSGGFGVVKLAVNTNTMEKVAVKIVQKVWLFARMFGGFYFFDPLVRD